MLGWLEVADLSLTTMVLPLLVLLPNCAVYCLCLPLLLRTVALEAQRSRLERARARATVGT